MSQLEFNQFEIFKTAIPSSRPADYSLGCLGGSVFIDLNNISDHLYLKRISFDGYGCCELPNNSVPLEKADSKHVKVLLNSDMLDQVEISKNILKLIELNKDLIWNDALHEYGFID